MFPEPSTATKSASSLRLASPLKVFTHCCVTWAYRAGKPSRKIKSKKKIVFILYVLCFKISQKYIANQGIAKRLFLENSPEKLITVQHILKKAKELKNFPTKLKNFITENFLRKWNENFIKLFPKYLTRLCV